MNSNRRLALALAITALAATRSNGAVVADSLPYIGTPDWTTGAFDPTSVDAQPNATTLGTAPYRSVFFGWGTAYNNVPSWTPGDDAAGNELTLTASFGPRATYGGPADWTAYMYDGAYSFEARFNPTRCEDYGYSNCYAPPALPGVDRYFGEPDRAGNSIRQCVARDTSVDHSYDILMKNGLLSYTIDGHSYSGLATAIGHYQLLIIGDESGYTGTGAGTMRISAVSFDNAPDADVALSAVPEPASWATMLGGFGLIGALRRRRAGSVAA